MGDQIVAAIEHGEAAEMERRKDETPEQIKIRNDAEDKEEEEASAARVAAINADQQQRVAKLMAADEAAKAEVAAKAVAAVTRPTPTWVTRRTSVWATPTPSQLHGWRIWESSLLLQGPDERPDSDYPLVNSSADIGRKIMVCEAIIKPAYAKYAFQRSYLDSARKIAIENHLPLVADDPHIDLCGWYSGEITGFNSSDHRILGSKHTIAFDGGGELAVRLKPVATAGSSLQYRTSFAVEDAAVSYRR
jgi:hypothetical protein